MRRVQDPIVLTVVAIFALFIGVNGAMLWFTLRQPLELVRADYYEQANQAPAAEAGAGLQIAVAVDASRTVLVLRLTDAQGRMLTGFSGSVKAYRPSASALDQNLNVREAPAGSGRYEVPFTVPQAGLWKLGIDMTRGPARVQRSLVWAAP